MHREIKFRHWCPEANHMTPHEEIRVLAADSFEDLFKEDNLGGFLMQWTGQKDSEGVDVYEGDILASTDTLPEIRAVVKFKDGAFVAYNKKDEVTWQFPLTYNSKPKVIGNIYENPKMKIYGR